MPAFTITRAGAEDAALILTLLTELAAYEKLLDSFSLTRDDIARDFFGPRPLVECDIASEDGVPVGIITWYWTYATFAARRSLFLEDLYVRPEYRGRGYGKRLLVHLAQTALAHRAQYLEWLVLDWNAPSIEFYKSLGARPLEDWLTYRLEGAAMTALGGS